ELTLFWSKLQRRVDPSIQIYLERCRQLSLLTKTVYHIFFLIKVIQSETEGAGLPTCIELCVRALRLESSESSPKVKISICKTISCLLPDDLEVKRACQLTEFLLEPTVDAYYAVEMLYNQPDQKYDEESLPVPNSLRCELLLVLKTRWPFDPEFWDWKTLKRQCLGLMGAEASIVSSIDELNDNEAYDQAEGCQEEEKNSTVNGLDCFDTFNVSNVEDEKQKKRNMKKMRERGYISERFRNWQAYMQYCVLCDKEFLGHRIVRHAQKHFKDGVYSCPICAQQYSSKENFVPHVTFHVKQSCKERLESMKPLRRLGKPTKKPATCKPKKSVAVSKQERPIKKNSLYLDDFIVFNDNDKSDEDEKDNQSDISIKEKQTLVNEFSCPVQFCEKGFKYFKNLIAHVKGHKDEEEAKRFLEIQSKKVICQYCRRQFVSLAHLNDHLQMHCGSQPYICIQMKCKASFETYADLLTHRKEHRVFRAKCMFPKCGRIFSAAYMLFDHEAQHYNTFTCKYPGCGKVYHSQLQLEKHLSEHMPEATLPESKAKTTAKQRKTSGTRTANVNTTVNDNPLTVNPLCDIAAPLLSVHGPVSEKDSNPLSVILTQKDQSFILGGSSDGVQQTVHLLDILPPPTEVNSSNNLQIQMLSSSPIITNQSLPPTDVLTPVDLSRESNNNGTLPQINTESSEILENQNKIVLAENTDQLDETKKFPHFHFEEPRLPVFKEGNVPCPIELNKDHINTAKFSKLKIEALSSISGDGQVGSIMPFETYNQTSQLCENNLQISGFGESSKQENVLSLSLETSSMLTTALPSVSSTVPAPIQTPPAQKFKCNVEGCTRIYNSVQSIGKHMKTAHPDHYDSFKAERRNRKKLKCGNSIMPLSDEKPTYCILSGEDGCRNPIFQPQIQCVSNPNFSNPLQHLPSSVFPTHLENLSPILSSVGSIMTQGLSKNVSDSILASDVGNLTNTTLTSQLEDLAKVVLPLKFENGSDPFLPMPTENDPLPVMSSLTGATVFPQLVSSTNHDHVLASGESAFVKEEPDAESSYSKQVDSTDIDANFNLDKSATMLSNNIDAKTRTSRNKEKKPRHSSRPKCPAIIRDGKFICSRCFRVFTNPRSLGGHLSKRAVCKPHNEYDTSHVAPQVDGQVSVLASMILSKQNVQSPPPLFNPEASVKKEPFLMPISNSNQTTQFFPSCVKSKDEARSVMGISDIAQSKALSLKVTSEGSMAMNKTPTVCSLQTNRTMEDNLNSHLNNLTDTEGNPLESIQNGLCPNPLLNPVEENNHMPGSLSSSRVSVISGPQNSPLTTAKKKGGGSRKKKKPVDVPAAVSASHELAKNLLAAVGSLPQSIGGNVQMSSDTQPNFMTYGSDLFENIAKHLNNANKQLLLSCINETIKAHSDVHTFSQIQVKQEKCDPLPSFTTNNKEHSDLQMQGGLTDNSFDNITSDTTETFSVNGNREGTCFSLPQCQDSVNSDIDITPEDVQNISAKNATSSNNTLNIPICSTSPTQETEIKPDILEIMDLVEKLQLEDSVFSEDQETDSAPECPSDYFPSSVIVPNPTLSVEDEPNDKCIAKPFICQEAECTYCAMTKDALFKHYAKVHYYTQEKIVEIKKHQLKFAPFKCVVSSCTKTFTRNSNLRAHCQTMHNFTPEQMVKLKIKRPYGRKSASESIYDHMQEIPQIIPEIEQCAEESIVVQQKLPEEIQEKQTLITAETLKEVVTAPIVPISASQTFQSVSKKCKKGSKIRKKKKEKEIMCTTEIQKDFKPSVPEFSTYKPYQCVHQGCTAAFTIQQNLMLHYQAVHKSASTFSLEEGEDCENGLTNKEFRCSETDCSRIFQEAASLIQHYMKLHEMIAEEIENVLGVHIGQFKCDQPSCTSLFTNCSRYIEHLEELHDIRMRQLKFDGEEMFKCDCEGCDRVYATRSNLLRHIFNKHNDKHQEHLIRPRKISLSDQDTTEDKTLKEKPRVPKQKCENESNSLKTKRYKACSADRDLKGGLEKAKQELLTLKYGRHTYSLKPRDVAFAECTENLSKQYPCMIRGCTSVFTNERNVIRHYKSHKLARAFIVKHRKTLIACKRRVRPKAKVDSTNLKVVEDPKSEHKEPTITQQKGSVSSWPEIIDESSLSTSQPSENEKDEMDELAELFISKLSNEDSTSSESQEKTLSLVSSDFQETSSCQSEPQKDTSNLRTINQKPLTTNRKRRFDQSDALSAETSSTASGDEVVTSIQTTEEPHLFDISSFKPMGFEVSFLKFLEESKEEESEEPDDSERSKTELQTVKKIIRLPVDEDELSMESSDSNPYLLFANPSLLPDIDNVKIVLDQKFNDYIDVVVKQINELKPVVILKRHKMCCNESTGASKEHILPVAEEATASF
ncbi:hypothetical protein GDO86_011956, partial [Hymenochirus boettgeri]